MRAAILVSTLLWACHHASPAGAPSGKDDLGVAPLIELDAGCVTASARTGLKQVELVVMLDSSGSMGDGVNGDPAQKWVPVGNGLKAFFADTNSKGLSASLQFFPLSDECNSSAYYFPAVDLTALPEADKFGTAISATTPAGGTPTRPAIIGAIAYAQNLQMMNANARVAIVLVTDGEPDDCESSVRNVGLEAAKVASTIPTYVIGLGDVSSLNEIAQDGMTGAPILVSVSNPTQTATDIQKALEMIRGQQISCSFAIPPPPSGSTLSTANVNVNYTSGAGADQTLVYSADCSNANGWQYDNPDNPTQVNLCATICTTIREDVGSKIDIIFGCKTLIP